MYVSPQSTKVIFWEQCSSQEKQFFEPSKLLDKPLSAEKRQSLRTADKYCVLPPTAEEWLKDNIMLRAIETRLAQLQRQQLEENSGTEPQLESIQAKLTVGEPGDKFEPVADMMASRVMSMPDNAVQRLLKPEEQTEPEVQTKPLANAITPIVQRAAMPVSDRSSQANGNLESRLNSSKGGGRPLPLDVRGFMEPRFGADFRGVRVHTGSEAVQMSRELGAQAFTHGSDVYFGEGKSPENHALTAHELTHVVQQTAGIQTQLTLKTPKSSLPVLSKKTVQGPTSQNCGGFSWTVQWELNKPSPTGGWVVQRLDFASNIKTKSGASVKSGFEPYVPYWEAWKINANQKVTTYSQTGDVYDDTFASPPSGDNTKGSKTETGTAQFYEGLTLPSSFKPDRSMPSGILPVTKSDPGLTGGSGNLAHILRATWNCCGSNKTTTVTTI